MLKKRDQTSDDGVGFWYPAGRRQLGALVLRRRKISTIPPDDRAVDRHPEARQSRFDCPDAPPVLPRANKI